MTMPLTEVHDDLYERLAAVCPRDLSPQEQERFQALIVGDGSRDTAAIPETLTRQLHALVPAPSRLRRSRGLLALAACLVAALGIWWWSRPPADPLNATFAGLATLMTGADDMIERTLRAPAPSTRERGWVYWSDTRQEGYVLVRGLRPNDPAEERYHVWVEDDARTLDAGMFDIPDFRCRFVMKMPVGDGQLAPSRVVVTLGPPAGGSPGDELVASVDMTPPSGD